MITIGSILLFFFVFSNLVVLRTLINFVFSLVQTIPTRMVLSTKELIVNAAALSYVITYILS